LEKVPDNDKLLKQKNKYYYFLGASSSLTKHEITLLFTKSGTQYNEVLWSPMGGIAALAMFAPDACIFELLDVDNNVSLATRRHDRCNKLLWDPSGRIIASCTTTNLRNAAAKGHPDDGFNIYTFQGAVLNQVKMEKLFQFIWRPRPKDLLTPEQKKMTIKNLRKY
jgi:translation initiation factor 3 subunit B